MSGGKVIGSQRRFPGWCQEPEKGAMRIPPACAPQEARDGIRVPSSGRSGQLSSSTSKETPEPAKLKTVRTRGTCKVVDQMLSFTVRRGDYETL